MSPRDELIASLEKQTATNFLELATKHYSKADPYDLQEIIEELNKDCSKSLWRSAELLCKNHLLGRNLLDADDEDGQQEGIAILRGLAALLTSIINVADKEKAGHAVPVLEMLHGLLPLIPNTGQEVQNGIAKIFEKWWQSELPRREFIVPHTVPYLIIKTLVQGSAVSDIQRLWSFRQAILILDFEDASCDHLKTLLLQCLIHPLYIQTEEGRRLLSFLFGLHPSFTDLVHSTIKQSIPNCPRPFLESYGEVYFRAWRSSAGVYLEKIENDCIQDLMHHAVHAQRTGSNNLSAALLKVLGFLHQQKVFRGMDSMLLRLYDPILWRALKVANIAVRANAASLLIDAFPLQNPESTREENDQLLQKQINVLLDLLADPAPLIRTMGVTGICRVLGIYWELVPSAVLQNLLKRLIKDMACDVSSSAVRAAVFQGLSFVVENALSHPIMAKVLPELKLHIHDTSERVRLAFVQLLLTVRNVRTIKFWDIVPMDHLLHRLAVDRPSIVRLLVKLLYVSYQPVSKEGEVQLARCVELLRTNQTAARKFYQFVHLHMSTSQAGKFILFLCRTVRGAVEGGAGSNVASAASTPEASPTPKSKAGRGGRGKGKKSPAAKPKAKGRARGRRVEVEEKDKDDEVDDDSVVASVSSDGDATTDETVISGNDEVLISGLLECMVIVWQSIVNKLKKPGCRTLTARLEKEFSTALPEFFNSFKSSSARAAILLLSGNVPAEAASALSVGCLEMFSAMPASTGHQEYAPLVDACCSWGHVGDVLDVLHGWLQKGLCPDAPAVAAAVAAAATPLSRKGSGRKKKKAAAVAQCAADRPVATSGQEPVAQAIFALDVLTWMLVQPSCRKAVMTTGSEQLERIITQLKSVLVIVEEHVASSIANQNQATERLRLLRNAFCMYTRLQVHLHAKACTDQSTSSATVDRSTCSASPVLSRTSAAPSEESLLSTFQLLLDWANNVLMKGLTCADDAALPEKMATMPRGKRKAGQSITSFPSSSVSDDLKPNSVAASIMQELLATCTEITVLGLADRWFLVALAQACSNLIDTGKVGVFMPYVCKLLFQLTVMFHDPVAIDASSAESDDPVPFLLQKVLQWLQEECTRDAESTKEKYFAMVQSTVAEVIRTYHRRHNATMQVSAAMVTLTMAIVGMVTGMAEEEYARDVCSSLSDLPPLSGMLLTVVSRSGPALRSFFEQLQKSLDVDAMDTIPSLMAVVHIVNCLRDCGQHQQLMLLVECLQEEVTAQAQAEHSLDGEQQAMLTKATDTVKAIHCELAEVV